LKCNFRIQLKISVGVSENEVLRRIFGHEREGVAGGGGFAWKTLDNEEPLKFYALPHIVKAIKSRGMR
jgi:hypothetical protein